MRIIDILLTKRSGHSSFSRLEIFEMVKVMRPVDL